MRPLSLKGHERPLTRIRLNREGDILFSSSKDKEKSICVWYVENGERIGTYSGHNGSVYDVDVKWDTELLVSASADSSFKIWNVETGKCLDTLQMESVVRSISLSYSGNLVAFTTTKITKTQPQLAIVDIRDSEKSFVLTNTVSAQSDCCIFSHLDDMVVIGCHDGSLHQYDLRNSGDAINFSNPHNFNVQDLQLSLDQGLIISSSADKTAKLHNARTLEQLKQYRSGRPVNSAAISPIRDHIILGGGEEAMSVTQTAASSGQFEAKLYHLVHETEFARFKGHFGPINSIAFNPTGDVVVSGGEDGYVRIQELDKEYLEFEFEY